MPLLKGGNTILYTVLLAYVTAESQAHESDDGERELAPRTPVPTLRRRRYVRRMSPGGWM